MHGRHGVSKMPVAVAVLSTLTFTTLLARADPAPEPKPEPKDRSSAIALSLGGSMVSVGLLAAGASNSNWPLFGVGVVSSLFAPAAGEIYAGNLFTPGLGLRVLSAGLAIAGFHAALEDGSGGGAGVLIVAGGIGYASGIIYDIATAGSAVDDYNQRLQLRVAPTVLPTASSGPAVGLGIGGSF